MTKFDRGGNIYEKGDIGMLFHKRENSVVVAGHRGICAEYPENTMLSYRKAIELGVDQLEIDLNLT